MVADTSEVGGSENLEVMAGAVNYNGFLLKELQKAMAGGERILDFGAGRATFASRMRDSGFDVVCVEPEPALTELLSGMGLEAHGSLQGLPEESLDGVYSLNVLEHIEDDEAVLREIFTRVKRGRPVYIYVPAFQILYSPMDSKVGHVRRYRLGELVAKCRAAGFTVEEAGYCDSLGFLASLLYKAIGSDDGTINQSSLTIYDRLIFPVSRILDFATARFFGKNVRVKLLRPSD